MRAFFEKRGLGAGFDKQIAAARDLWRRDESELNEHAAPCSHDGVGWIERLSREVGYDRVERAFYLLMGGVIFAGCIAIVMAGFRGAEPARPVEGVTEVQLASPPQQETARTPQANQNLSAAAPTADPAPTPVESVAAAPPQEPAAAAPTVAPRESPTVAEEAMPPAQGEAAPAQNLASELPPAIETPRESEMAMAAPNAARHEAAEPEPEAAPPAAARDANAGADDKAGAGERAAKCFVKVAGRVLTSGNCRVSRKGAAVTFLHSGQPVTVSPRRGREWALTLGGRNIGTVYKVGDCWGSRRHTWICSKGA